MTEKDAVKCAQIEELRDDPRLWVVPVKRASTARWPTKLWRNVVDARLLDILVCPVCKGPLEYDKKAQE
jgi:hypothetical protein